MAARAASVTECSRWARRSAEHTTPIISLPFKKITLYSKPGSSASDHKLSNGETGAEGHSSAFAHAGGRADVSAMPRPLCIISFTSFLDSPPCSGWGCTSSSPLEDRLRAVGASLPAGTESGKFTLPLGARIRKLSSLASGWDNSET